MNFFLGAPVGTDKEIFDKIKAQQDVLAEIVGELARRFGDDLLQFCGRILVTYQRQFLEDVVQEVFLAAYCNIQHFDINRGAKGIKPWLYGIARNKCIDMLRKKQHGKIAISEFTELEPDPGCDEKDEHNIQKIQAKRAFIELNIDERLMVATYLMGWFSREEMASMSGYYSLGSYDKQMYRIREKMGKFVEGKRDDISK